MAEGHLNRGAVAPVRLATRAIDLNWGCFCPPKGVQQYLKTFAAATVMGAGISQGKPLVSRGQRPQMLFSVRQRIRQAPLKASPAQWVCGSELRSPALHAGPVGGEVSWWDEGILEEERRWGGR